MKLPRIIFAIGTILFLLIGIYLKITDSTVNGHYTSKYGQWHDSVLSANALFFFAALFAGIWAWLTQLSRKER